MTDQTAKLAAVEEKRAMLIAERKARLNHIDQIKKETVQLLDKIEELDTRIAALNHQGTRTNPEDEITVDDEGNIQIKGPGGVFDIKRMAKRG